MSYDCFMLNFPMAAAGEADLSDIDAPSTPGKIPQTAIRFLRTPACPRSMSSSNSINVTETQERVESGFGRTMTFWLRLGGLAFEAAY
jgi:hypothetical protein